MSHRNVPIKYTSREFASIKRDLVDYARRYYPETFRDFNEAGFGSLMLDTVAYVGDILSFYLDYQVNESFLSTAIEYDNVLKLTRQLGYRYQGNPTSTGIASFFVLVPANAIGTGPDTNYMPILRKGSQFESLDGNGFILSENIDFAASNNDVIVARVNETTGTPTFFAVKTQGIVISGELVETSIDVGAHSRFLRIPVAGDNIAEIVSVFDTEGHEYFEVDYLSQNVIYKEVVNRTSSDNVKNIMKPFIVPRRFVTEEARGEVSLQFGYGSESELKSNKIADPSNVVLKFHGRSYISDTGFDPSNLVQTDKFGVVPSNTTLLITYRQNNTAAVNISANSLVNVVSPNFIFENITTLSSDSTSTVMNSLQVTNEEPILGDVSVPNSNEIRRRAVDNFATQNRIVTRQDYVSYAYSMPPKFGAIKRANLVQDSDSFKRNLNLYIISENTSGNLANTNNLVKQNLKTWIVKNKMIHDTIDILDGKIINLGINFVLIVDHSMNKYDVLNDAINTLVEHFKNLPDFGESFQITKVYSVLNSVRGVVDTTDVEVLSKVGGLYSDTFHGIRENISEDGRAIELDENLIWEIKYPFDDIRGSVR